MATEITKGARSPMTCALEPTDLTDRLAAWRSVTGRALSREQGPGWIRGTYPRAVRPELEKLIEAEAECCSFLSFEVLEREDVVDLRLEFPPEFAPMVAALTAG